MNAEPLNLGWRKTFFSGKIDLGKTGGEVGSGGKSWIIQLLPRIPVQLVFYMGDAEFSSADRLLIDQATVNFLEFEFLAVLATIFVEQLIEEVSTY